ncbi:uncharacterized protein LOC103011935 [Balaenoptera acutorostrata]|uniref:Uncharacterized protein LOC103011935 n=1 Tax=Balaenoptera acutorostrata TaxID=9767 RepID=A0A384BG14_BALAC|nr:uncharacterized protein LOC103011935 [Balaenoptera acutorostrata]
MLTVKLKPKHRPFCFSVKGHVKMLRLDIINSVVTAVFMIVISVLALIPETTTYIVIGGDLINSFITAVFLFLVAVLAMQEKERSHLFYVGGSLCLTAAIVCLIDETVVTKTMRNTMKKALGIETKASASAAQEPIPPTRASANAPAGLWARLPQEATVSANPTRRREQRLQPPAAPRGLARPRGECSARRRGHHRSRRGRGGSRAGSGRPRTPEVLAAGRAGPRVARRRRGVAGRRGLACGD